MRGMYHYDHPGYGYRHWHGGLFFLPIIPIIFGVFVLGFIFKTGLWLPLLIGFVVWKVASHRHHGHHYGHHHHHHGHYHGEGFGPFSEMDGRKRKLREALYGEGDGEKPKRDYGDYI